MTEEKDKTQQNNFGVFNTADNVKEDIFSNHVGTVFTGAKIYQNSNEAFSISTEYLKGVAEYRVKFDLVNAGLQTLYKKAYGDTEITQETQKKFENLSELIVTSGDLAFATPDTMASSAFWCANAFCKVAYDMEEKMGIHTGIFKKDKSLIGLVSDGVKYRAEQGWSMGKSLLNSIGGYFSKSQEEKVEEKDFDFGKEYNAMLDEGKKIKDLCSFVENLGDKFHALPKEEQKRISDIGAKLREAKKNLDSYKPKNRSKAEKRFIKKLDRYR